MNIHKNYINDKQILQEYSLALNIDFSKIPSNYRKDKDFLRNCKYGFLSSANCNLKQSHFQNQTPIQNQTQTSFKETEVEAINLLLKDKNGQNKFLSIIKGNTLAIGENPAELLDRSIELHNIYLKNGFITRLISFRAFTALSFDEQTNPEIHYIVRFNKHNDIDELPYQLSTIFSNIFVFALNNIDGNGVAAQIQVDTRASDIFTRLAISTTHARKHYLPSLKKDEFLLKDSEYERLASISKDKA